MTEEGGARSGHGTALLMLLLANFFWGLSFPVIKSLVQLHAQLLPDSGNWFVAAMTVAPRFLIAFLLLPLLRGPRLFKFQGTEIRQGIALGCFASLGMVFQNDGLQFTDASVSAFLTQMYAILIPLWVALRSKRLPGRRVWESVALVLGGVAILGRFDWTTLSLGRGEVETLISSLFFMGQILVLDNPRYAGNDPVRVTFAMVAVQMLLSWTLVACTAPSFAAPWVFWSNGPWVLLNCTLAVFCTIGAFLLMNTWQPRITATEAGLVYCVEPVFGSALALCLPALISAWASITYPNEQVTWHLLVGGGLVTAANLWLQLGPRRATA